MLEGHARQPAVERGRVRAYPLGPWLPHMQPGADRAHRGDAPDRKLETANASAARTCSGSASGMHSGALRRAVPVPGSCAARMIIMSSSYEPARATAGHAANAAPIRPCPETVGDIRRKRRRDT